MTLLLVLDEALQYRKFTVVARRLGLTQSAVSHAMARLRDIFEDPLFLRRPFGVEPTQRALELAPRVADLVRLARAAVEKRPAFDPCTSDRLFRVTGLDYEVSWLGPPLIRALCEEAPGVRLSFRSLVRNEAMRALADGEVDLAVGYFLKTPPDIVVQPLYAERYLVAASRSNRLLEGGLTLDAYCDRLRHILVSLDGSFAGTVDSALAALGRQRQVVATLPLFLPALEAVARSDVIVTMPARVVEAYADRFNVRAYEPPLALRSFTLMVAWHRRNEADGGLRWLVDRFPTDPPGAG